MQFIERIYVHRNVLLTPKMLFVLSSGIPHSHSFSIQVKSIFWIDSGNQNMWQVIGMDVRRESPRPV
jgi:hypothetical protein